MPTETATAKRYRSDRWHRLDRLFKSAGGLDAYVADRRSEGASWHAIAMSIARDIAKHPDVPPPTVTTLIRWYEPDDTRTAA